MSLMVVEPVAGIAALIAGLAFVVLPGFNLGWWPLRRVGGVTMLATAFIVSIAGVILVGSILLALRIFDAGILGAVTAVAAVTGLIPAARWARDAMRGRRRMVIAVGAATLLAAWCVPWFTTAFADGIPQSSTFQWYYWELGRDLSEAGGVPATVWEYGREIRWLPDYLGFNLVSEAYRGFAGLWASDPTLLSVWRLVPVAVALPLTYALFRRWMSREAALVAMVAVLITVFFTIKFNVYKPESLGVAVGLAAIYLLVVGVRTRVAGWILVAGVAIGLAMSIHAIAATVFGIAMAGVGGVEWLALRSGRRRMLVALLSGGALAIIVVAGYGWAMQGRAFVAADAFRPEIVDGMDPTWIYLNRSIGDFSDPPVPSLNDQLATGVLSPWPGVSIRDPNDWWWYGLIGVGVAAGILFGGRRLRIGVGAGSASVAMLVVVMLYFALSFDTYVPRHTGLARIGQYIPLFVAALVGLAMDGGLLLVRGIAWTWRPGPRLLAAVTLVAAVFATPILLERYADDARFGETGDGALVELQRLTRPGDVVLTNVVATGWLEFTTAGEAPLEGRQPLIEDVELLTAVNELLLDLHTFLIDPDDEDARAAIDALGPRWILVTNEPTLLGTRQWFGGSIERFLQDPGYVLVWRDGNVAIFEPVVPTSQDQPLGPAIDIAARALIGLALVAASIVAVAVVVGGWRPSRPSRASRGATGWHRDP